MIAKKKLIEVALPLSEINDASAYDKMPGIGAHPKGIHHWWARLPLPVSRAVLFASVVDDPSAHPERFPTDEAQERERERLFGIIRDLMQRQLHKHPEIYAEARAEMLKYCDGKLPPVLDPFAGGGSIPLEAARLGMEAYAGDLNPVAVLLNKVYLEIVPRWADWPPVNPEDRSRIGSTAGWRGAGGLAADVRYYGRVILERAREKIGHLYPTVRVTAEMAAEHPHLEPYVGKALPVIAWLWARTVPSPNPAARGAHVPLMSTFWLSSKKGSEAYLEPVVDRTAGTWRFVVRTGAPGDREAVKAGTKTGRATFRCLLTGDPIGDDYIKAQGRAGRLQTRLTAIVADTGRGRIYLPATEEHEVVARQAAPAWRPEETIAHDPRALWTPPYGLRTFGDLFTPRQLTALVTLSELIREVRAEVRRDAERAGLSPAEVEDYARAVTTFLALNLDRAADLGNILCTWNHSDQVARNLFKRQAIPMVWDFAEVNVLGDVVGGWSTCVERTGKCIDSFAVSHQGHARPIDAASSWDGLGNVLVSTDPPYYDNIGYAALSDFFYVWLRRTVGELYPDLFGTILVPKAPELVAAPERFGGDRHKAREHFEQGFRRAFAVLREKMDPRFPLTVYYAFKQDDEESGADEEEGSGGGKGHRLDRTTGWETMLNALIETGFQITATWPVRSAQKWRQNAMGANALASYIVLACRPRPEDAPQTDRRAFVAELKGELPAALRRLQQGNIAPVDFAQAAIGPGMAIYSKYRRILEASGRPMSVRTALALINQTLTEVLSEQEDEFDADTRWAIAWYEQHGFEEGEFGQAELLSKAKVTSVSALVEAGIVASRGGKVRLLRPAELPGDWNPDKDRRLPVWEATHHLVRIYYDEKAGDVATAELLRKLGARGELARDLAYRLFDLAEKKGRSQDAQAYNALVLGWPEVARLAGEHRTSQKDLGFSAEPED
ncbi:MAG: Adenine-specific DNA methylase containing a Zn-ribbon [Candidatus Bipolaricaulis sibiricus]|uniref:Adenine-specific DNA methylase containing a Zn-ribbon n=1 Tax=Bipolaricaulis sibiricus TaxID=2501609 RepID=A0A410FSN3_BIPS1|nr:MAG: Adenine-specific DNA methylase containing a Zn-ribbon [Candidatus Bipolaricaulis sibiricus]